MVILGIAAACSLQACSPDSSVVATSSQPDADPNVQVSQTAPLSAADTPSGSATEFLLPTASPEQWSSTASMVSVDDRLPANTGLTGSLIMRGAMGPALMSLPSTKVGPLDGALPAVDTPAVVSGDRRWLAYLEGESSPEQLVIVDASGKSQPVLNWPRDRSWKLVAWLDRSRLLAGEYWLTDGTAFVYDAQSGEMTALPPAFPQTTEDGDIKAGEPSGLPIVYYDASLERVAIPRYLASENRRTMELRSVPDAEMLWRGASSGADPLWSPDGSSLLAILDGSEAAAGDGCRNLVQVSRDGEARLLEDCALLGSAWSPDGSSIAVWTGGPEEVCDDGYAFSSLMVIDLEQKRKHVNHICMDASQGQIPKNQPPMWSPDGKYVVFNRQDPFMEPLDAVMLDLEQHKAHLLPAAREVLGWIW